LQTAKKGWAASRRSSPVPVAGPKTFINLLLKRARVEGFVAIDHLDRRPRDGLRTLVRRRKTAIPDRSPEKAPTAISRLFDGSHHGKLIVKVRRSPP
jgi:NADPH-dependent curcumin reductase